MKDQLTPKFGQVLRKKRLQKGWSMEHLAEKAGLTLNFIGNVERGEKSPTLSSVERICRALGCRPVDLFRGL